MTATISTDRNDVIKAIRTALRARSGKAWSVRGGTGSAWGWITVAAPPARMPDGRMTLMDRAELAKLLGLDLNGIGNRGIDIAASTAYRREYVERAQGNTPTVRGERYWD